MKCIAITSRGTKCTKDVIGDRHVYADQTLDFDNYCSSHIWRQPHVKNPRSLQEVWSGSEVNSGSERPCDWGTEPSKPPQVAKRGVALMPVGQPSGAVPAFLEFTLKNASAPTVKKPVLYPHQREARESQKLCNRLFPWRCA